MKIYVTKYALTSGIQIYDANLIQDTKICVVEVNSSSSMYFHDNEWHEDKESAVKQAEIMKDKKIKSLKKSLEKIEKLKF
jgi:hypothetical protein